MTGRETPANYYILPFKEVVPCDSWTFWGMGTIGSATQATYCWLHDGFLGRLGSLSGPCWKLGPCFSFISTQLFSTSVQKDFSEHSLSAHRLHKVIFPSSSITSLKQSQKRKEQPGAEGRHLRSCYKGYTLFYLWRAEGELKKEQERRHWGRKSKPRERWSQHMYWNTSTQTIWILIR